jgi:hypothetical protein
MEDKLKTLEKAVVELTMEKTVLREKLTEQTERADRNYKWWQEAEKKLKELNPEEVCQ